MRRHVVMADLVEWETGPWWIAHEHPERPVDRWTVWSWDCDRCMAHLIASAHIVGDLYAEEFTVHGNAVSTTVSATLAEARAWRADQGLMTL
jgi:hypothetical protein